MNKKVHTIFCWVLAMSLIWSPLSAFSYNTESVMDMDMSRCHEMESVKHVRLVDADSVNTITANESHCNACTDGSTCLDMSDCSKRAGQVAAFDISSIIFVQIVQRISISTEQFTSYLSQIISPDLQPPVV